MNKLTTGTTESRQSKHIELCDAAMRFKIVSNELAQLRADILGEPVNPEEISDTSQPMSLAQTLEYLPAIIRDNAASCMELTSQIRTLLF